MSCKNCKIEEKPIFPNTYWTPKMLTEFMNFYGQSQDMQKLRLFQILQTKVQGSSTLAPANSVFIILNVWGSGQTQFDNVPYNVLASASFIACRSIRETGGINPTNVTYAQYTWE